MAPTATPWCTLSGKLILQEGQFLNDSGALEVLSSLSTGKTVYGISWDGTNTPWIDGSGDILTLTGGQFTASIVATLNVQLIDNNPRGITWDGTDTLWCGQGAGKLYRTAGQFGALTGSLSIVGIDTIVEDVTWDGTNTPWCGRQSNKIYTQSGTLEDGLSIKTSQLSVGLASQTQIHGVSWDGTNTPWCGTSPSKLYLQSGTALDTISTKTTFDVYANFGDFATGICTDDVDSRLGAPSILLTPDPVAIPAVVPTATVVNPAHRVFAEPVAVLSVVPTHVIDVGITLSPDPVVATVTIPTATLSHDLGTEISGRSDRLPRQEIRTRRMADQTGFDLRSPSGLHLSAAGLMVRHRTDGGLGLDANGNFVIVQDPIKQDGGGVGLTLQDDRGLEIDGGLAAKTAAPIDVDSTGIHLNYGSGLSLSGGELVVDDTAFVPYTGASAPVDLGEHALTTTGAITGGAITGDAITGDSLAIAGSFVAGDFSITTDGNEIILATSVELDPPYSFGFEQVYDSQGASPPNNSRILWRTNFGGDVTDIMELSGNGLSVGAVDNTNYAVYVDDRGVGGDAIRFTNGSAIWDFLSDDGGLYNSTNGTIAVDTDAFLDVNGDVAGVSLALSGDAVVKGRVLTNSLEPFDIEAIACFANSIDRPDASDGFAFRIYRRAAEGDGYIQLYVDKDRVPTVQGGSGGSWINYIGGKHQFFDISTSTKIMYINDGLVEIFELTNIGNGANYAAFDADGELTLHGTARVNKEIAFSLDSIGKGATAPTLTRLGNTVGYKFGINDDGYMQFEIPVDWDSTTDITIAIHIYTDDAYVTTTNEVETRWQGTWSAIPENGTEAVDGATHTGTLDSGDINLPTVGKALQEVHVGTIAAAGLIKDDVVCVKLSRVALDGGTDPANDPVLIHAEYEYIANKLGEPT